LAAIDFATIIFASTFYYAKAFARLYPSRDFLSKRVLNYVL